MSAAATRDGFKWAWDKTDGGKLSSLEEALNAAIKAQAGATQDTLPCQQGLFLISTRKQLDDSAPHSSGKWHPRSDRGW